MKLMSRCLTLVGVAAAASRIFTGGAYKGRFLPKSLSYLTFFVIQARAMHEVKPPVAEGA